MQVAITGATGLVGSALADRLTKDGHEVRPVSRSWRGPDTIVWDPAAGKLDPADLAGVDAVVHLAGESIASGRWTEQVKDRIHASRVNGTSLIASTMAALDPRPRALVSVSGVNYYGDRGDEVATEETGLGDQFLSRVCADWEAAADPAREAGIRVVHPRFGIIQSRKATVLKIQLPLYRAGLGGKLGSGQQFWSWITITDVVGILVHALTDDTLEGPVNATAPHPVRQEEYARTLAGILGRPALLPVPELGPRLLMGQMADELLFASMNVVPERITAAGYTFRHPTLEEGLRAVLAERS